MSSSKRLIDLSLEEFSAALASEESTPAGGSTAASVAAQGAALGAMVIRLSAARQAGEVRGYLQGSAEEMEDLVDCLLELVDRDAEAYRSYMQALKAQAPAELQAQCAQAALDAPAEVAELGLIALARLDRHRDQISEHLRADLGVAEACLAGAVRGALGVAEVNLVGLGEAASMAQASASLEELRSELDRLSTRVPNP